MRALVLALLAALAVAASPAAAATDWSRTPGVERAPVLPVTVRDTEGTPVRVASAARIVSLNGDLTEVVYALGLGDRLVGVDTSATYPAAARAKTNIGYQRQLNAEGIVALAPTIVIGSTLAGPPGAIAQLRAAGVPLLIIPEYEHLKGPVQKIRRVAAALGVPKRGAVLAERVERQIRAQSRRAAVLARGKAKPRVAFLYLRGPRVQLIGGRDSRSNVIIRYARGIDAGEEAGIRDFAPITPEALVTAAPDVIVVLDAGLESVGGVDGLLRIPGVAQTPAGRARRVLSYDDQLLLGLGPRTGSAIRKLASGLYGPR